MGGVALTGAPYPNPHRRKTQKDLSHKPPYRCNTATWAAPPNCLATPPSLGAAASWRYAPEDVPQGGSDGLLRWLLE